MKCSIEVNNQIENFDIGKVAKHASGAVLYSVKDTVILATVAREDKMVSEDFMPLTVQYVEKAYSAGRIPGGYVKRETKPGDFETLTARIIDRSLRPLFPKGYRYPTQIVLFVLSCDEEVDLQVAALNAASAALYVSDIPVNIPVGGVRVGCIDDKFVINPSNSELKQSTLDLYVAGTKNDLLMIEMRSLPSIQDEPIPMTSLDTMLDPTITTSIMQNQNINEFNEDKMLQAIEFASEAILRSTSAYEEAFSPYKKQDAVLEYAAELEDESIYAYVEKIYDQEIKNALCKMAKSERAVELEKVVDAILKEEIAQKEEWERELVSAVVGAYKRKLVRKMIVHDKTRADGRGLKDVRKISIETNILPRTHGSCLFTRGETQALVVCTLGSDQDGQMYDLLTEKNPQTETFMVNYNFPGFSVGEASPLRAPGRRELGHGNLAKRAIAPTVDINSLQTIRLVSEILESNGSSSMATVCGGSLALRAAGVNTPKLVAGVAMGLIFEDDKYSILTDIMGLEDHDGDMDFKVAGTKDGITALQMDIKLGGIDLAILKEALLQAKEGREHILGIMQQANDEIVLNEKALPKLELFDVDPSKIVDIIGQAGKTIREIIEKFEVSVDLDRDKGEVKILGPNKEKVDAAKDYIIKITQKDNSRHNRKHKDKKEYGKIPSFVPGEIVDGEVKKIVEFGAFIEVPGGIDALLHVSKISSEERVEIISDYLKVGQKVRVKILEQKGHKISLELVHE